MQTMSFVAFLFAAVVLAVSTGPGIAYVVARTVAAVRLLQSSAARATRARLLTRVSGVTMLGLGAYLALAQREA